MDYDVYNPYCASIAINKEVVNDYDNEWMYVFNHQFTESEYRMLDNLLEHVYNKTTNNESIQNILKNVYLVDKDDDLEYKYKEIIRDLLAVLESKEFNDEIKGLLDEVFKITDDEIEIEFMKPEAIYLGTNFPEDEQEKYKELIESEDVRIFKIKEKDGQLFKALI